MAKEKSGWTPSETQQKLLDLARRMRPNLKVTTDGPAAGKSPAPSAPKAEASTTSLPVTFGTSVMDTDETAAPRDFLTSITSAVGTMLSSPARTDWTVSPIGFVENGLAANIETLAGLPEPVQQSLRALATGTGEPVGAVIHQICEFFVTEESEWAEAPLADALTFYVEQYQLR